jgi:hypothetical protein
MRRLILVLALAATAGLTLASTGHAATRHCGLTARIDGVRYDVHETKGSLPCSTVKAAISTYLRTFKAPKHWTCFLGHGSSPYAASCARGTTVVARAYAPS